MPREPLIRDLLEGLQAALREQLRSPLDDDALAAALQRHTMLVAREVAADQCRKNLLFPREDIVELVRVWFPLPPKRVLREEPVPGCAADILYRVRDGVFEMWPGAGEWSPMAGVAADRFDLMRHALDLRDRPYREVPDNGGLDGA